MARPITLSNGNILVAFNERGYVTDFFYPYIGVENHVRGDEHKIGIWQNGGLSWLGDAPWSVNQSLQKESYISETKYYNSATNLELLATDCVYNEKNIFLRKVTVTNHGEETDISIFFHQVFSIFGTSQEDTAYYDPTKNAIIHYEGRRVFFIYAETSDTPFSDYSIGLHGIEGKEGVYKDAEDGVLEKNAIEHGHVDSIMSIPLHLRKGESREVYYWITVAETKQEVYDLHEFIRYKHANHLLEATQKFWHAWLTRQNSLHLLSFNEDIEDMYKKSLFYIRGNIDNRGAILASPDSSMLQNGRDTYSYMWPRDGAMTVLALLEVGEYNLSKHFFKFCNDVLEPDGYVMHKYKADKSLGSSWHAFIQNGKPILPIQEDETALILIALWKYYEKTKDIDFIDTHYYSFIKKAGMFLVDYIDEKTNLPKPSYDLWEEKHGSSTFTASTVYGGLQACASLAKLFEKTNTEQVFLHTAEKVKKGILEHLYDKEKGIFIKQLKSDGPSLIYDTTLDCSSVYGVFMFGVLPPHDERVVSSIKKIEENLWNKNGIGGVPRYENDKYYMQVDGVPNPWYITTLWQAQYHIISANTKEDLAKAFSILEWVVTHAPKLRVLSEQVHPFTGQQLSATPLTWSHAEFVRTVLMYQEKYTEINNFNVH